MASDVYVLGSLAQMVLAYLDEQGLAMPAIRDDLNRRKPYELTPIEQWWEWLEAINQQHFRPALGLHIGHCAQLHHVGLLGYLMASHEDCGHALMAFQRFQPLLHNLNPSQVTILKDRVRVNWDDRYGTSTQISNEVFAAALITNLRTLSNCSDVTFHKVSFPGPAPSQSAQYESLWGCEIEFGAPQMSFEFPMDYLVKPIPTHDPNLCAILERQAVLLMEQRPRPDHFISGLHELIEVAVEQGNATAEALAESMGMPLRSFYRELEKRSINFKEMVRSIRYQLAKKYLSDSRLDLVEVALKLGYSDQSAFARAFKRWHGVAPNQFRQIALDKPPNH